MLLASLVLPVVLLTLLAAAALVAVLVFEIWMFIDAIKNPHLDPTARALWLVGMLLLHPFVAIVYYFIARQEPPHQI